MKSVSGGCLVPKSSSLMSVKTVENGMNSYVLVPALAARALQALLTT